MPVIYFTVTNDLRFDQRMNRICSSLSGIGYDVVLVGRKTKHSVPLSAKPYRQHRIPCLFSRGKWFYIEYNIRLFFFLLLKKMDAVCAIDLDTILPCYYISRLKKVKRVYDAHELFCEMKEVVTRPGIYRIWKWIERKTVPHFPNGYTVNTLIAEEFDRMYGCRYETIRSIPYYSEPAHENITEKFILYQGAVNEGRSFETLIPAMAYIHLPLVICGDGNFMEQAKALVKKHGLEDKITFKGMVPPEELALITKRAYIGITLFEKDARSNYYSLANRFFDYMMAGVPQVCVDYPVYRELNNFYGMAVLTGSVEPEAIASAINRLIDDPEEWSRIRENCLAAAKELNWENEEKKLHSIYKKLLG